MAQGSNQIGEAFVDVRLRMDKLESDIAQIKPLIERIAGEQEKVANNTEQSARAAGGWAAALNGVWNTYNSIISTMRQALSIGEQIGRVLVVNTEKADALIIKMSGASSAARAMVSNERIKELRDDQRLYQDAAHTSALNGGGAYAALQYAYAYFSTGRTPAQIREELETEVRTQQLEVGGKMTTEARIAEQLVNQGGISGFRGDVAGVTGNVNSLRESIDRLNETMRSLPR